MTKGKKTMNAMSRRPKSLVDVLIKSPFINQRFGSLV